MRLNRIIPSTIKRVNLHTKPELNSKIREETISNLHSYQYKGKDQISERIKQLDREWDTERVLEANAASLVLVSSIIGLRTSKNWFYLTGIIGFFLLMHAVQGWCPPVPILRRIGVRTAEEINKEKTALKIFRNDFSSIKYKIYELIDDIEKQ